MCQELPTVGGGEEAVTLTRAVLPGVDWPFRHLGIDSELGNNGLFSQISNILMHNGMTYSVKDACLLYALSSSGGGDLDFLCICYNHVCNK